MVRHVLAGAVVTLLASAPNASAQVETVALFNASLLETPENLAIDHADNKYVSLALTGEVRKIAPDGAQSTFVTLPLGAPPLTFCGSFFAGLTGITFDEQDNLYANLASCDPAGRGVWKIPHDGQPPSRIAALSMQSLPNGIVHHRDSLYIADSVVGVIWRVADTGGTPAIWATGQALAQIPNGLPGPNGLKRSKASSTSPIRRKARWSPFAFGRTARPARRGHTRPASSATTSRSTCTATCTAGPIRSIRSCALRPTARSIRSSPRSMASTARLPSCSDAAAKASTFM
jgi:hypothetical protein